MRENTREKKEGGKKEKSREGGVERGMPIETVARFPETAAAPLASTKRPLHTFLIIERFSLKSLSLSLSSPFLLFSRVQVRSRCYRASRGAAALGSFASVISGFDLHAAVLLYFLFPLFLRYKKGKER